MPTPDLQPALLAVQPRTYHRRRDVIHLPLGHCVVGSRHAELWIEVPSTDGADGPLLRWSIDGIDTGAACLASLAGAAEGAADFDADPLFAAARTAAGALPRLNHTNPAERAPESAHLPQPSKP